LNLALVGTLRHAGLALAIGLGACLNAGLLYIQLRKKSILLPAAGMPVFILKVLR
jgi:putative peptidoglycan lipid II flippase